MNHDVGDLQVSQSFRKRPEFPPFPIGASFLKFFLFLVVLNSLESEISEFPVVLNTAEVMLD